MPCKIYASAVCWTAYIEQPGMKLLWKWHVYVNNGITNILRENMFFLANFCRFLVPLDKDNKGSRDDIRSYYTFKKKKTLKLKNYPKITM